MACYPYLTFCVLIKCKGHILQCYAIRTLFFVFWWHCVAISFGGSCILIKLHIHILWWHAIHTLRFDNIVGSYQDDILSALSQPTFQRRINVVSTLWINVENETKSEVRFSTLHNVDTTSVSDVETTSKQRWYKVVST